MGDAPRWQVGQIVRLTHGWHGEELVTVERVTPGGRAVVGDHTYMPSGRRVGASGWRAETISALAEGEEAKVRERIAQRKALGQLRAAAERVERAARDTSASSDTLRRAVTALVRIEHELKAAPDVR